MAVRMSAASELAKWVSLEEWIRTSAMCRWPSWSRMMSASTSRSKNFESPSTSFRTYSFRASDTSPWRVLHVICMGRLLGGRGIGLFHALAIAGRQDSELVAVLLYRPSGDLDPLGPQLLDDLLVGEWVVGLLAGD